MANQAITLLGKELFWQVLLCKIIFWDTWCLPWMSEFYCFCGVYCLIVNLFNPKCWQCWVLIMDNIHPFEIINVDVIVFDSQCQTWHGNCFVSLSKWDWNCMVEQFWHWFFLFFRCCFWMTLHSPIRFDFVFCVGMTSVQSSLILMITFLLIDHLQFGMKHFFVSLSKRDWNCVCKQFQFKLWFGLFDFIFGWTQSNPFAIDLSFCCKF